MLVTELTLEKLGGVDGLLQRPDISQTPAGKAKRVVAMESLLLLGFGPRTPLAIRELATRAASRLRRAAGHRELAAS